MGDSLTKNLFGDNSQMVGFERPNPSVEIFDKVVTEIYNKEDIALKTELNDKQIIAFSRCKVFAQRFNISIISDIVDEVSYRSVSKNRKGRKEFENISKANLGMHSEDEGRSIPDRLLGRR